MRNKIYKEKLEQELVVLEQELQTVARKNLVNGDWEVVSPEENISISDENEVADTIDDLENNVAILKDLEDRYNNIKKALEKIENKTFGKCEICQSDIEDDRLGANPAATTCKKHINENLEN